MGKSKGKNSKAANVFKVAGARSLKAKNKAKQFTGQLKKLNERTQKKTLEVDGQLASLHSTLLKKATPVADKGAAVISELKKVLECNALDAQEVESQKDEINQLSAISMS